MGSLQIIFGSIPSVKRAGSHRRSSPACPPPPYLFQGVEERELGPTKGFSPSHSLHLLSRWAPGVRQASGFLRVALLLCLITSRFLCLFVFLVWFPVLFISQPFFLVCSVSRVFLQVTSLLSTGSLVFFVLRNLLCSGGREISDTCICVWCTREKVKD